MTTISTYRPLQREQNQPVAPIEDCRRKPTSRRPCAQMISALKEDAIHVSMSTITVALSEVLAEAHHAAGKHFVAAPVFGRPEAAAAAKLFIVAAGEPELLDRCQLLFDDLGQKTFVVDQLPSKANLVKLSGNFLVASVMSAWARRWR